MISFVDTEISSNRQVIKDIGAVTTEGKKLHSSSLSRLTHFIQGSDFDTGHNILDFDVLFIAESLEQANISVKSIIDTLPLSPLLFPTRPYHNLVKDDKLNPNESNNPLQDAIKAKELFEDEINAFDRLPQPLQEIYSTLLRDTQPFQGFFNYIKEQPQTASCQNLIAYFFKEQICGEVDFISIIETDPIALAYCLALIYAFTQENEKASITPPWVLKKYPKVNDIMHRLRYEPCKSGCPYCRKSLDIKKGLKDIFGFHNFRDFNGKALQKEAVQAAVENKSLLAIFPTGGGKSLTFQLPALMAGQATRALTVIISPLQSLMKDQVDNLEEKGITKAVTINGLLDPIERGKSFQRVEDGDAKLLYISPESLRSKSIERLLIHRKVARFVIDEAHCFSTWGQDFRVDYLYIAEFINNLTKKKNLTHPIAVSCFTATAKQKVIEDITQYFKKRLNIIIELYTTKSTRKNLTYKVLHVDKQENKYIVIRYLLDQKGQPAIIYVSRTKKAVNLTERLQQDGFKACAYYGKMENEQKTKNQRAFITGEVSIMVATSAFGMGVDKKDVGLVIHYDISDSLENYIQESGRAGRDKDILADCYILFNEEDLDKHFILLNQTQLSLKEIQQVWRAIKGLTKFRFQFSNSALEIARKAGWEENILDIETRVKTAIATLEETGYLKRAQNSPQIFATSILPKTAQDAVRKIEASPLLNGNQQKNAIRIIKKLIAEKNRNPPEGGEIGESRVDYISDTLGIPINKVQEIIQLMRELKILADAKDLTAFIKNGHHKSPSLTRVHLFIKLERLLCSQFQSEKKIHSSKRT